MRTVQLGLLRRQLFRLLPAIRRRTKTQDHEFKAVCSQKYFLKQNQLCVLLHDLPHVLDSPITIILHGARILYISRQQQCELHSAATGSDLQVLCVKLLLTLDPATPIFQAVAFDMPKCFLNHCATRNS